MFDNGLFCWPVWLSCTFMPVLQVKAASFAVLQLPAQDTHLSYLLLIKSFRWGSNNEQTSRFHNVLQIGKKTTRCSMTCSTNEAHNDLASTDCVLLFEKTFNSHNISHFTYQTFFGEYYEGPWKDNCWVNCIAQTSRILKWFHSIASHTLAEYNFYIISMYISICTLPLIKRFPSC